MFDLVALLAAYDDQVRPAETGNLAVGVRAEIDGPIVRIVGRHRGFVSAPFDLGIEGKALDALITRQRDYFAERGEALEWKTRAHDKPAELIERLCAAGFAPEDTETVVIGSADAMARLDMRLPEGVTIRQTTAESDMWAIAAMESRVWGRDFSWAAEDLIGRVQNGPDALAALVAESDDQVVSAGWLGFKPPTEFAALWGGSTLEEWRGRGIYRALVATRARLAVARGVRYLQVDASASSRPILERLGFAAVTTTTPYVWKPCGPPRP